MEERKTNAQEIARAIREFLKEVEWNYSYDSEDHLFRFNMQIDGMIKQLVFYIDVREDHYLTYGVSMIGVDPQDPDAMTAMAEFICRANYGIKNGNFELDMRDGEIRYKSFVDCWGGVPDSEVIAHSLYFPMFTFEQYSPGIVGIILGNSTPEEAIELCESPNRMRNRH